jgi:hypothetical protein
MASWRWATELVTWVSPEWVAMAPDTTTKPYSSHFCPLFLRYNGKKAYTLRAAKEKIVLFKIYCTRSSKQQDWKGNVKSKLYRLLLFSILYAIYTGNKGINVYRKKRYRQIMNNGLKYKTVLLCPRRRIQLFAARIYIWRPCSLPIALVAAVQYWKWTLLTYFTF